MRRLIPALLVLPLLLAAPQPAAAQIAMPVIDAANVAQAILTYKRLKKQLEEHVRTANRLRTRTTQAINQIRHLRDAANGRIGALRQSFSALSSDPVDLLLNADFGAWRTRLGGDSEDIVAALEAMQDGSLAAFLLDELNAADSINDADLLALYPDTARSTQLAEAWREGRESGDRIRAADLATAETAGRLTTLLDNAQQSLAGRRAQSQLSNTALQQAVVANQLTAAEVDLALAQFLAIQAQQEALQRHEAELIERQQLARWVRQETAAQARFQTYLDAEDARRANYRTAFRLRIH